MGDWFQVVVDRDAFEEEASTLGSGVLDWMVAEGVVLAGPDAGCVLGGTGHRPGPRFDKAAEDSPGRAFLRLVSNGVSVVTGRTVFDAGQGGFRLVCRQCRVTSEPGERWAEAVQDWYDGSERGVLACPRCGHCEPLAEWDHDPPYGFGNLGFRFWNWPPLKGSFVTEVARRLGHRTVLVAGKLWCPPSGRWLRSE